MSDHTPRSLPTSSADRPPHSTPPLSLQAPSDISLNQPLSAPPTSASGLPGRPTLPTRSSTTGSQGLDRDHSAPQMAHARSEDFSHTSSYEASACKNSYGSLPKASASSSLVYDDSTDSQQLRPRPPRSQHSDESNRRASIASLSSNNSESSSYSNPRPPLTVSSSSTTLTTSSCAACGRGLQGPLVRALNTVFHLYCFKCMDCGDVVANKFFPIDGPDGKQQPLCERDYFRRLNLICAKCGMALRASYITACNKKFHVEHFTCSLCSTLFGQHDSYYEHDGDVFCHFHYSTRFATKCAGCNSAILKQFVEINRNSRDECWHPECYMINKFWNVKVMSRRPTSTASLERQALGSEADYYADEERKETPESLKDKQAKMEDKVYKIWTVLSAFEESSAACISDMLRQVSNGQYLDAIRMAEKFILHVEVLFAAIDDLEFSFSRINTKGMSHVREARMLCRKTVELFGLLSDTQETGARRMGMTQELLALITGLAHYLKILIRIALTGALKLEREHDISDAIMVFLDKLRLLAVQGGNPTAKRLVKGSNGEPAISIPGSNTGTQGVTYGFKSLAPELAGESPFGVARDGSSKPISNPPSDLCVRCGLTVEEDCVRLGTYQRWHSHCIQCIHCGKVAAVPVKEPPKSVTDDKDGQQQPKLSTARRPPANVGHFVYDPAQRKNTTSFGEIPTAIFCAEHAHPGCRAGFTAVSRLEQYAFLLNVALRRLYLLLKKQGVLPLSPGAATPTVDTREKESDPYRNSADVLKMNSVHLARKTSASAQLPKRSTIVESPAGKSVRAIDAPLSHKPQEIAASRSAQPSQASSSHSRPPHNHHQHGRSPPIPPQHPPHGVREQQQFPPPHRPVPTRQNSNPPDGQGHVIRPEFARNNTEVMIVDDSVPSSPAGGVEDPIADSLDNKITLANIPQLMQMEHQHRMPSQNSTPFIAELSSQELSIVKHAAVAMLYRSPLRDQFDLEEILELVELKKSGFWGKLFKAGGDKKIKKKGVFGVPLELLVERDGADCSLGASPAAAVRVPSFIDDVVSAMRQMDMSVEGIFRRNGNIRRLKDLAEAIDRDPESVDLSQDNPVQLAALLKKFLRDLPDPLLTFKLHRLVIATQGMASESDRHRFLHLVALILPKSHRDTMEVLFVFLKWVASFAHVDHEVGSKMDLGNLATVICPSILYSRGSNAVQDDSFGAIRVITALLENQDEYYTVPVELMGILRDHELFANYMDLPGKELMKKCDAYLLKSRGNAQHSRPPPSHTSHNGDMQNGRTPMSPGDLRPSMPPVAMSHMNVNANPNRPMHPGMPPSHNTFPLPSSPIESQGHFSRAQLQQPPQPGSPDPSWSQPPASIVPGPPPSRPYANSSNGGGSPSSSSRPPSFVQSRPSGEYNSSQQPQQTNGYSSAVRQRT